MESTAYPSRSRHRGQAAVREGESLSELAADHEAHLVHDLLGGVGQTRTRRSPTGGEQDACRERQGSVRQRRPRALAGRPGEE